MRLRFSIRTSRSVIADAQSSPIVRYCTFLVGPQEAAPRIDVETAVSVRHERPRYFEHSRVTRERPLSKFGQLPIIAGRQICANFTDLTFHLVEIVDQPFRCWGDGGPNGDRAADRLIGEEEASFVVCQSI